MDQTFFGITGITKSGKSVISSYLASEYGFYEQPFAKPIKEALIAMGFSHNQIYGNLKDTPIAWLNGLTPRKLMQTLGTEWGRGHDKDFWVKIWTEEIWKLSNKTLFVTDDYRFPNEAGALRMKWAILIRVIRPSLELPDVSAHESERHIMNLPVDFTIYNDGSIQALHSAVDDIILQSAPWLEKREYPNG